MVSREERVAEVVRRFSVDFPSLAVARRDLACLGHRAVHESSKGEPRGCKWYTKATYLFKQPGGSKFGRWYEDVLPALALHAGWFASLDEARAFAGEVKQACKQGRSTRLSASKLSMSEEEVVAGFRRDFPSLEAARGDPASLGFVSVLEKAGGRAGHWLSPAQRFFSGKRYTQGQWYDAVLPGLMFRAGWFSSLDEARTFAGEVKRACYVRGLKRLSKRMLSMSEEEVVAGFRRDFSSLEAARADLTCLGHKRIHDAAAVRRGHWYVPSRHIFKRADGKPGRWYEDVLPALAVRVGWFSSLDEARAFGSVVREACEVTGRRKAVEARRVIGSDALVAGFRRDFPSLEAASIDLVCLGREQVERAARADAGHWFHSARSVFNSRGRKQGDYYLDVLPGLAVRVGWFSSLDEAEAFARRVRVACRVAAARTRFEESRAAINDKIVSAFKNDFPSLAEAESDLTCLGFSAASVAARAKDVSWFYLARTFFTSQRKSQAGYYNDILPNLVLLAGWFASLDEARAFSARVKAACDSVGRRKQGESRSRKLELETVAAFKRDFPSLADARRDLTRFKNSVIDAIAAKTSRHWSRSAVSLFKQPNGKPGRWYKDVLPQLFFRSGWFASLEDARAFAVEVHVACEASRRRKQSATLKARGTPPISNKRRRGYAVVVGTLQGEVQGTSFEPVNGLLSLNSVEARAGGGNGLARVVITSPRTLRSSISPGELARLKMRTDDWSGKVAEVYAQAFPFIAPYLTTRLLLLHVFSLVREGRLPSLSEGASFMSGPGEVYGALQDLRAELERNGLRVPKITDVDAEKDMLAKSANPEKVCARLPSTPFGGASLDFVECSSLYQFHPKKHPTLVRDSLSEARRVLKHGGVLMLSSTGKKFGENFEEGLRRLGFDVVTPANSRLHLSDAVQDALRALDPRLLDKALNAVGETFYLVAVKSARTLVEAPAGSFVFENPKQDLPEEAMALARHARKFDEDIGQDGRAASNVALVERTLDALPPEAHARNAVLIQTVLSKYLLDSRPQKPKEDEVMDNALRLEREAGRVGVRSRSGDVSYRAGVQAGSSDADKYFILLKRMAAGHVAKLREAAKNSVASPRAGARVA